MRCQTASSMLENERDEFLSFGDSLLDEGTCLIVWDSKQCDDLSIHLHNELVAVITVNQK